MKNKNLDSYQGKRSYRLLALLASAVLILSLTVSLQLGREAALACLVWATAAALLVSLLVTALGSIHKDFLSQFVSGPCDGGERQM